MGITGCDSETHYDFRSVTSTHTGSSPEETEDDEIFYPQTELSTSDCTPFGYFFQLRMWNVMSDMSHY